VGRTASVDLGAARRAAGFGLSTRRLDAGSFASFTTGRTGLRTNSPPQFGHTPRDRRCTRAGLRQHVQRRRSPAGRTSGDVEELAAIFDACSRRVIGYAISKRIDTPP
jgi:hypothetical protein